ncbi:MULTISPECIES: DISARM system phospholipase D-like protein DrmC [unclassified Endozoicomonas]|uniref:DISARM system phospholipase D-like protein DrmC n=1 Tax=unclassified Endozoicomonas TaxID=2644528 RepID=UPI003BB542D4
MEKLLEAVNNLVKSTHPDKLRQLAMLIKDAEPPINQTAFANSWKASSLSRGKLLCTLQEWDESCISKYELAGMILGACSSAHSGNSNGSVELVWTGPDTTIVPVRQTSAVLHEVIDKAQHSLFIVSFVITDIKATATALEAAINRGVKLSILTESSKERGGSLDYDPGENIANRLPLASVYYWPEENRPDGGIGSVHAKCAVADDSLAFITSANLTGYALEHNMEMGALITGGRVPGNLKNHLDALILTNIVKVINVSS